MHHNQFWNLLARKLSGEASEAEIQELADLIKTNPELSYTETNISSVWKSRQPENILETEMAFQQHLFKLSHETAFPDKLTVPAKERLAPVAAKRKWIGKALMLAAVVITGITAALLTTGKQDQLRTAAFQTEEVYTRPGTRTKLTLPDKSVVWLNAGSKLTYSQPFGENERTVFFTGEAFFDVVKSDKPFIIHTSGVKIRVLGTSFNVRNYPDEKKIETSLVRGSVEITIDKSPEKKYMLKPNEKLTLNTDSAAIQHKKRKENTPLALLSNLSYTDDSTITETSWMDNKLVFDDRSFEAIAKEMERWYGVIIHFKNDRVKKERLTGGFEKETVTRALNILQEIAAFRFTIKGNEITITE